MRLLKTKMGFQPTFSSHILCFLRSSGETSAKRLSTNGAQESPELAMPKLMQASLWSFGLTKTLDFIRPFLAKADIKQAWSALLA